jgi:hypothetical protein
MTCGTPLDCHKSLLRLSFSDNHLLALENDFTLEFYNELTEPLIVMKLGP